MQALSGVSEAPRDLAMGARSDDPAVLGTATLPPGHRCRCQTLLSYRPEVVKPVQEAGISSVLAQDA